MKKILIGVILFFILMGLVLFITTRVSSAHAVAQVGVRNSPTVERSIGPVQHVILTMFTQKTGPTGKGCTTAMYFVLGSNGSEWVRVQLSIANYREKWTIDEIVEGMRTRRNPDCIYG
jgi:hypothetical protein